VFKGGKINRNTIFHTFNFITSNFTWNRW